MAALFCVFCGAASPSLTPAPVIIAFGIFLDTYSLGWKFHSPAVDSYIDFQEGASVSVAIIDPNS
jgi:hypothetical protein